MCNNALQIETRHLEILSEILSKVPPEYQVWAFGSRARGTAKPYSDLDLAIVGPKPLPLQLLTTLSMDFEESDLPWTVDILDFQAISDSFRDQILQNHVVVSSR